MITVDFKTIGNILAVDSKKKKIETDAILRDGKWIKGKFVIGKEGVKVVSEEGVYKFNPKIYLNNDAKFGFVNVDDKFHIFGDFVSEHSINTFWYGVVEGMLYLFWTDEDGYVGKEVDTEKIDFEVDTSIGCICCSGEIPRWFNYDAGYHIEIWDHIPDWARGVIIHEKKIYILREVNSRIAPCKLDKNECDFCYFTIYEGNVVKKFPAEFFAGHASYDERRWAYKVIIPSIAGLKVFSLKNRDG